MINYARVFILILVMSCDFVYAHDTTHIHPLITAEISELISNTDDATGAYKDIYELLPDEDKDPGIPSTVSQRLYWGTDFDESGIKTAIEDGTPLPKYLQKDQLQFYHESFNVMNGVVFEDNPSNKVIHHFYHAISGEPLTALAKDSSRRAMAAFNESVEWMGKLSDESVALSFFNFGIALHHVEDMSTVARMKCNVIRDKPL